VIFPPAAALSIVLNGSVVRSYRPAYVARGHVMTPVSPYLTAVASSIECTPEGVVVRRGDRFATAAVHDGYVEIAPVLAALGARVSYEAARRALIVELEPAAPVATATPFNPAVPLAPPSAVFTPIPAPTTRPTVIGRPMPRRTPLPFSASPRPKK
jgi:hypothetical protein